MIHKRPWRRAAALVLMVAGGLTMWLSTSVSTGLIVFAVGVLLEVIGLSLERRARR